MCDQSFFSSSFLSKQLAAPAKKVTFSIRSVTPKACSYLRHYLMTWQPSECPTNETAYVRKGTREASIHASNFPAILLSFKAEGNRFHAAFLRVSTSLMAFFLELAFHPKMKVPMFLLFACSIRFCHALSPSLPSWRKPEMAIKMRLGLVMGAELDMGPMYWRVTFGAHLLLF